MLLYNMNHVCCAARLFVQLVDLFQFYMMFPIDDHTGDPVSDEDVTAAHYEKVQQVTLIATLFCELMTQAGCRR